jgi:hypothetical protein
VIEISTQPCNEQPMRVGIRSEVHEMAPGEVRTFPL